MTEVEGPLSERVTHKVWKVRLAAYEELEKIFNVAEEGDPKFNEYGSIWKKVVADSNAAAQEKGLDACLAYLKATTPKDAAKQAGILGDPLVEKCLSQREKTKAKAVEIFLLFTELETPLPIIESIIKVGCAHKVPKVRQASIAALKDIVKTFGTKPLPVKTILPALAGMFDHPDGAIRDEAAALTVELYRWLGQIVRTQVDSLKPIQIKELETAFEEAKAQGKPTPLRYTISGMPAVVAAPTSGGAPSGGGVVVAEKEEEELDPYDLADPVDVLSKMPADWHDQIGQSKWTIRRDAVDALINLASTPRLKPGDYGEVVKSLKKLLGDANVVVVGKAAKALGLLAKGLRKDFSYTKQILPAMLDKFKEKKGQVVDPMNEALDFMYDGCISLPDVMEEIVETEKAKVPKIRQDTLAWLTRCFKKPNNAAKRQAISKCVKPLGNFFIAALDDSTPEVRDAAAACFGALAGVVGERPLNPYLNKLDAIKLKKVKDCFPEIIPSGVPAAAPPPQEEPEDKPAAKKSAPGKKASKPPPPQPEPEDEEDKPVPAKKAAPKAKTATKPPAKATAAATSSGTKAKPGQKPKKGKEEVVPKMSAEDALNKAKEIFPEKMLAEFASGNWKNRLQAVNDFSAFVDKMDDVQENVEVIIRQLENKPGFKDSNFQVLSTMLNLVTKLTKTVDTFPKGGVAVVVPGLMEKLPDAKLKAPGSECLTAMAEATSPNFVMSQLFKFGTQHKNPKVTQEILVWVSSCIEEFGMAGVQVAALIAFVKEGFESPNTGVRTQAIKTLCSAKKFVGAGIRDFVADVKPALLATIDDEFSKVGDAPEVSRKGKAQDEESASGGGELPREDISGSISSKLVAMLADNNWKTRKEGLDEIDSILVGANKRIESNLGGLPAALKPRIQDSNMNLAINAMEVLGRIATAMGPSIEKHMKLLIPPAISNYTFNKKQVPAAVSAMLDVWVVETGFAPFIPYLVPAVAVENSQARLDCLTWITKHLPMQPNPTKLDVVQLARPLMSCLEDKNAEVRKLATALLEACMNHSSVDTIKKQIPADLKPASKTQVTAVIDSLKLKVQSQQSSGKESPPLEDSKKPASKSAKSTAKPSSKVSSIPASPAPNAAPTTKTPGKEKTPSADGPLLLPNDKKSSREKRDKSIKWVFEAENRKELVDNFSDMMQGCVDPALHAKLFHADFNNHIKAATELQDAITRGEFKEEFVQSFDLWLKWVSLRLYETNLASLKKALEFLTTLVDVLASDEEGYQMSDHEASLFLPHFVEKFGNNNDMIRQQMRTLIRSLGKIFPVSKIFKFLVEGLKSKNARTRVENLDEMGSLIQRHGLTVTSATPKPIPLIAEHIAERDASVRGSALTTLVKALAASPSADAFWKNFPKDFPESSKSALQDKIKYTQLDELKPAVPSTSNLKVPKSSQAPAAKAEILPKVEAPVEVQVEEEIKEVPKLPKVQVEKVEDPFSLDLDKIELPVSSVEIPLLESTNQSSIDHNDVTNDLIDSLTLVDDIPKLIETLKILNMNEDESFFVANADRLVIPLVADLEIAFASNPIEVRLYKYLLNTLHRMLKFPRVSTAISPPVLKKLLLGIERQIGEDKFGNVQDGVFLGHALKLLTMQILDSCDPNTTFPILLQALRESLPSEFSFGPQPRFIELQMESLIKLTKSLATFMMNPSFNVDVILKETVWALSVRLEKTSLEMFKMAYSWAMH
eukprot:TRINITY_DN6464_c0_g2_i3.p1 TRINITY_DN6464_c0_g2~~TRINITY_DN6464_c0_g2_i3.p1  ORF type:complete len:1712 (-),score=696.34 TRINITY_DN6464_c0_g2_i3:1217-6352(-)